MTCEENYESQAAYQELQDLIELISKDIDDIEDDIQQRISDKTDKRYIKLCIRLVRSEEIYDRLSDLQESINVEINNVEN